MKRTLSLLFVLLALSALAPALATAATPRAPERALSEATALFGPRAGASAGEGREASAVLRDLALVLPRLKGADRRRARAILARPSEADDQFGNYFGPEAGASPICDAQICVHWGTAPKHEPDPADADANGIPDYAEEVLLAGAQSYAVENGVLGWRDAKSDGAAGARGGKGGQGQVDIHLVDLGRNLFGYASPDPGERGRSRSGYLVVDNDYNGFSGTPLDLMRVTVAHEYNHILQFGYDVAEDAWLFESTATWVEDMVYPAIDDYLNFVSDFAKFPFKPMAEANHRATRLYGSAMWNHWLAAATGAATIRRVWELSPDVSPRDFAIAAYDAAIREAGGGSFSRQFAVFAAASAEWNSNAAFPDAGRYPEMRRSGKLTAPRKLKLDHTAYRLYKVEGNGTRKLTVKAAKGTRAALALVGRPDPAIGGPVETQLKYLPRGGRRSVELSDIGRFARVTALVINADGRVRGESRNYSRDDRSFRVSLKG